jgi:hypothetical protein
MKIFQNVGFVAFLMGMAMLCFFSPWTSTPAGSSAAHDSLGYAAVWSQRFAAVPGARVDSGAFATLAGVVAFFAIVIAAGAYFFRNKRGSEREDV